MLILHRHKWLALAQKTVWLLLVIAWTSSMAGTPVIFQPRPATVEAYPGGKAEFPCGVLSNWLASPPHWNINGREYRISELPSGYNYYGNPDRVIHRPVSMADDFRQIYCSYDVYDLDIQDYITYNSPTMTLRVVPFNFGSPGQTSSCSARTPDHFLIDNAIIDPLIPGQIRKTSLRIRGITFDQVVLLNSDTGFTPLEQSVSGVILALVDGNTGPVEVSQITIDSSRKLYVVGLPTEPDDNELVSASGYQGSGSDPDNSTIEAHKGPAWKPVVQFLPYLTQHGILCRQSLCHFENLQFIHGGLNPASALLKQQGKDGVLAIVNSVFYAVSGAGHQILVQDGALQLYDSDLYTQGIIAPVQTNRQPSICNSHLTCTGSTACPLDLDLRPHSPSGKPVTGNHLSVATQAATYSGPTASFPSLVIFEPEEPAEEAPADKAANHSSGTPGLSLASTMISLLLTYGLLPKQL